jgi:hypothetical protein
VRVRTCISSSTPSPDANAIAGAQPCPEEVVVIALSLRASRSAVAGELLRGWLGTPLSLQHTASPSMIHERARRRASPSTISGKRSAGRYRDGCRAERGRPDYPISGHKLGRNPAMQQSPWSRGASHRVRKRSIRTTG